MDCETRSIEGVISSFGRRGVEVVALSSQQNKPPPAFKSRYVNHTAFGPSVRDEGAYLGFLEDLSYRGVLLYSTDSAAEFVSKYEQRIRDMGYLVNIPDHATFRSAFDKDRVYEACIRCEIPTINTKVVRSVSDIRAAAKSFGFPLLLKPTRLAGSRFQRISEEDEIRSAYQSMTALLGSDEFATQQSGLIVQEFISCDFDDLFCVECYASKDGRRREVLSIQKIRPDIYSDGKVGSRLFVGETIQCPELEGFSERLLDCVGWSGLAHLDWLFSKKHASFLLCELNPRLPGFSNFPTKLGFEMAWYYYADLTETPTRSFQFKPALYFEALRHPGDLTDNVRAVLAGELSLWDYLKPYLRIFTFRYTVVFDVFYGRDLRLTWENYRRDLRSFVGRVLNKLFHL